MIKCPTCGTNLVENDYGDLVCQNCGIVESKKESEEKEVGYVG